MSLDIRYPTSPDLLIGTYVRFRPGEVAYLEYSQAAQVNVYYTQRIMQSTGLRTGTAVAFELMPGVQPDLEYLRVDDPTKAVLALHLEEILKGHPVS